MGRWPLPLSVALTICLQVQAQPNTISEPAIRPEDRAHWAFQPPRRPEVPKVARPSWARTPIDTFILSRLEAAGLQPAAPAERLTLLRRVHVDLVGLPPSPEEQEQFLGDSSAGAYEKVVDRLLTSPHFGERWAQHWLDAVRFAESNGYEVDGDRPHAWRYRDYVVRAFNADKPYNRFLTEQLAGDELAAGKDVPANADLWIATGMHRCGPVHVVSGNIDPAVARQEVLTEYVQGVGSAVLGLTMNCARCHDHKFDPVSQADYYRLEAFFAGAKFKDVSFHTTAEAMETTARVQEITRKLDGLKAKVKAIDGPYVTKLRAANLEKIPSALREVLKIDAKKRTKEQTQLAADAETLIKVSWDQLVAALSPADREARQELRDQIHVLEGERERWQKPTAWAVTNDKEPPPTHLLKRGELSRKGAVVEPAYPRVISFSEAPAKGRLTRTDLAAWVTAERNPLPARVFVNRVWQHLFGHGLVRTPNDFGTRGERPTHPELLDYLATEFMANGWRLKPLVRTLVLSATYMQATGAAPPTDPDHKLLSRMPRRRLDGESLRDAMLTAAGTLTRQVGGQSVRVPLEPETYDLLFTEGEPDGLWHVTADATQHARRSLYLFAKRNVRLPLMESFDQPDRLTPCADRGVSTAAPQALILMNGPVAQSQSRALAATLARECGSDLATQVDRAYRRVLGRPPSKAEVQEAIEFIRGQETIIAERARARLAAGVPDELPEKADPIRAAAVADFCLALFNANEFVYR
jgi:hypothetical protein